MIKGNSLPGRQRCVGQGEPKGRGLDSGCATSCLYGPGLCLSTQTPTLLQGPPGVLGGRGAIVPTYNDSAGYRRLHEAPLAGTFANTVPGPAFG